MHVMDVMFIMVQRIRNMIRHFIHCGSQRREKKRFKHLNSFCNGGRGKGRGATFDLTQCAHLVVAFDIREFDAAEPRSLPHSLE